MPSDFDEQVFHIPLIDYDMIINFASKTGAEARLCKKLKDNSDLQVQLTEMNTVGNLCEGKAIIFIDEKNFVRVCLKIEVAERVILESFCEQCLAGAPCTHVLDFIHWLYQKNLEAESTATVLRASMDLEQPFIMRMDEFFKREEPGEPNIPTLGLRDPWKMRFREAMLRAMDDISEEKAALYVHYRVGFEGLEPALIQYALLDACNNNIRDLSSFMKHMQYQSKHGTFNRLYSVTRSSYKTLLWAEAQYMRVRCSIAQRIAEREDESGDQEILDNLYCKFRDIYSEERKQMKLRKREILKDAEKLSKKTYQECGILLKESYPYLCAMPDGMADDHIVEIKLPKCSLDFKKYMLVPQTIPLKYAAQLQIQMYMANVTKALYVVVSPTYERDNELHYAWVNMNVNFLNNLLHNVEVFWKTIAFPRLQSKYLDNLLPVKGKKSEIPKEKKKRSDNKPKKD